MITYQVIKIDTGEVMFSNGDYNICIQWIDDFADILNYTIIEV